MLGIIVLDPLVGLMARGTNRCYEVDLVEMLNLKTKPFVLQLQSIVLVNNHKFSNAQQCVNVTSTRSPVTKPARLFLGYFLYLYKYLYNTSSCTGTLFSYHGNKIEFIAKIDNPVRTVGLSVL